MGCTGGGRFCMKLIASIWMLIRGLELTSGGRQTCSDGMACCGRLSPAESLYMSSCLSMQLHAFCVLRMLCTCCQVSQSNFPFCLGGPLPSWTPGTKSEHRLMAWAKHHDFIAYLIHECWTVSGPFLMKSFDWSLRSTETHNCKSVLPIMLFKEVSEIVFSASLCWMWVGRRRTPINIESQKIQKGCLSACCKLFIAVPFFFERHGSFTHENHEIFTEISRPRVFGEECQVRCEDDVWHSQQDSDVLICDWFGREIPLQTSSIRLEQPNWHEQSSRKKEINHRILYIDHSQLLLA